MSSSPYAPAAQMLTQIWTTHKSIKTLAYDKKGSLRCSKATYAQVCHVLQSKSILDALLERVGGFAHIRNQGLLYVLLYELLLGPNRKIRGGGALKRELLKKEADLRRMLVDIQQKSNSTDASTATTVSFPRYVRVNTLQTDLDAAISSLKSAQHDKIYVDPHVPNLLVLPPGTPMHTSQLVRTGKVVLQDKSSCFSALCLVHGSKHILEGDYLDACAAPGNKSSHLAALLAEDDQMSQQQPRTVYALDRSSSRLALLKRRIQQLVPANHTCVRVIPQHVDFLKTDPSDFPSLRGILLDPSCSGSGIFTSPDRSSSEENDPSQHDNSSRLVSLSNFQLVALKHAMSFPQVERIVYSTCSLHEQENECVVRQALETYPNEWQLVAPACLWGWTRRGHVAAGLSAAQARCLIRADRDDDTNGFFVCYMERSAATSTGSSLEGNSANRKLQAKHDIPAVAKRLGIPVYNGEFSDQNAETKGTAEGEGKEMGQTTPSGKSMDSQSPRKNAKSKSTSKKRQKKLAWKQRQTEQKLQRLREKQSRPARNSQS